ncbi:MAG: hypothetical protein IJP03_04170 [Christensenellaceae bacterium]|nr:hypothetical protein [Christensenellaceae bacterium]
MIVPMKKVSLIMLGEQKKDALKKLRKLGLVHIEIAEGCGERLGELKEQISLLEGMVFSVDQKKKMEQKDITLEEALLAAKELGRLAEEKSDCKARQIALTGELERLKSWGELDPESMAQLAQKGFDILVCEMPKAEFEALGEGVKAVRLAGDKHTVRCLLLAEEGEEAAQLAKYRLEMPKTSTADMRQQVQQLEERMAAIDEKIQSYGAYVDGTKKAIKTLEKEVEFETYATGMGGSDLAGDGEKPVSVAYFKGYIEAGEVDRLRQTAKENAWGLMVEDPTEDDNVPTKLKNNKFVSLIYPLTDFLGTVPGYFEFDISGWFLMFILIFFGIIFGDGGYGLLVTAVAAVPMIKARMAKKPVSPMILLIGLFGLATILWGTLTCTWFGLSPDLLPEWLKSLSIPVISNVYADTIWQPFWMQGAEGGLTTTQNVQVLCFTLALVQLAVAHIMCAKRNRKSLKLLGDIGAIMELIGIYYLVLSLVVNSQVFSFSLVIGGIPVGTVAIGLIGVGFVMNFVFSNYEGSIVKAILSSLANIVSVLLGVVNVFSDIVSYIRLWAVGLAGAAISATVNELVSPLLGNFLLMIFAIVLLVFGHGLNMILNVLSVIVHGIRLNTLEFSSHLDMSWSGHKFKPFKEQN